MKSIAEALEEFEQLIDIKIRNGYALHVASNPDEDAFCRRNIERSDKEFESAKASLIARMEGLEWEIDNVWKRHNLMLSWIKQKERDDSTRIINELNSKEYLPTPPSKGETT